MAEHVRIHSLPRMEQATMLLALGGWMDGGMVSTGTVRQVMEGRELVRVADIEPDEFYIHNFPGSMELAALFRPAVKYADGLVKSFEWPENSVLADPPAGMAFFVGKEPNLRWKLFADCLLDVAERLGVSRIVFMGSFGGTVPHTREPRLFGSVSHERLRPLLREHGLRPSTYEGPASFATFLLIEAPRRGMDMISIAAEIPGYLQGPNPLSIEAVTRRLAAMLNLPVDLAGLRRASTEWELQVTEAVEKDQDLTATVRKLEEEYDNQLIGLE